MEYGLSQFFGLLAIFFNFIRFRQSTRRAILLWGGPPLLALTVSQILNHQYQGAAMTFASCISALLQSLWGEKNALHQWARSAIGIAAGAIGLCISPPSAFWYTWLPLAGYSTSRLGEMFHSYLMLRILWLFSTSLFLTYYLLYENWTCVLAEILVLGMQARFFLRLYLEHVARAKPVRT